MKLSERDKKALGLLLFVLILISTTVTMFYPERINYKFSLKEIKDKTVMADELEVKIKGNEPIIEDKFLELYSLEDVSARIERKAENLKQGIKKEDLSIHMPSILISLEQNAKKNKVDLIIDYDKIETHFNNKKNIEEEMELIEYSADSNGINNKEETDADKVVSNEADDIKDLNHEDKAEDIKKDKDLDLKNQNKENKNEGVTIERRKEEDKSMNDIHEVNRAIVNNSIPNIDGIDITTVPVRIKGKYSDIREFVRYLDTIDYLEPSFVDLSSNGEEVIGAILIHVFHGEVD